MRGGRHRFPVLAMVMVLGVLSAGLAGADAWAAVDPNPDYVKYYPVAASYQGKPEDLSEIAARFLGSSNRAVDIYNLNAGRPQPDGTALASRTDLRAGWQLVLPWDAVGTGVRYGVLPTTAGTGAAPPAAAGGQAESAQGSRPTAPGSQPPAPGSQPTARVNPAAPAPPTTAGQPTAGQGSCQASGASSSQTDWASLRLAPDQAWTGSRGKGQLVAVVDSGVDANLAPLQGHVAIGADVVSGSGSGDTDCLGSGTAMATIIAAQPAQGSNFVGIAPDATVMPVKVVTTAPHPRASDEATAIAVAVTAGATVVALGGYVDVTDGGVAKAVADALAHNVVVVVCAAAAGTGGGITSEDAAKGVLRVGGVGVDGQAASDYRPAAVDVVAPGANIRALGITGVGTTTVSGTQYAVAFVAGEVALVRAAYPGLTAAQVVHRVEATAEQPASPVPDAKYGWGLINPGSAVSKVLLEEKTGSPAVARRAGRFRPAGTSQVVALVLIIVVGAAVVLLVVRVRRLVRAPADGPEDGQVASDPVDTGPDAGPRDARSDSHDEQSITA